MFCHFECKNTQICNNLKMFLGKTCNNLKMFPFSAVRRHIDRRSHIRSPDRTFRRQAALSAQRHFPPSGGTFRAAALSAVRRHIPHRGTLTLFPLAESGISRSKRRKHQQAASQRSALVSVVCSHTATWQIRHD